MSPPIAPPTGDPRRNRLKAIGFMLMALLCFSALDATAKWLSPRIGTLETTWVRYLVAFLMVSAFLNPVTKPGLMRTRRPGLQAIRSIILFASTYLNFLALEHLQLAQTITIMFLQPMLVALAAGPLLGEWVGPRRLIAIGVGFLGVVIVTRPGLGGIHWAAIFSFAGVICYAAFSLITRFLAGEDPPETTMFYSTAAGVLILTPFMPFLWKATPDATTWGMMALIGACGAVGHWFLILAHRLAPASMLAPFIYSQIVWMIALGYLVFHDVPDRFTLIGAGIVVASGLYLFHRERVRKEGREG